MFRTRLVRAALILLLVTALPMVAGAQQVTPSVTVSDQAIENGTVTVDMVVAAGPGWIVVHVDQNGSPGPVIGHAAVEEGENENVVVEIDEDQATETLHAMLHDDLGTVGEYEFPGPDVPVQVNGQIVMEPFQVQAQVTPTPGVTPEVTPGVTPEVTPGVTPEPEALPELGGPSPWALMLVTAGAVILFSGLALNLARRPR